MDSADSFGAAACKSNEGRVPVSGPAHKLLVVTTNHAEAAKKGSLNIARFVKTHPEALKDTTYTLARHREHLPWRTFAVTNGIDMPEFFAPVKSFSKPVDLVFVFTGQGAQWATMGARLIDDFPSALQDVILMDEALSALEPDAAPTWTIRGTNSYFPEFDVSLSS